jgi:microcystin-dependent protein
MDPFIATVSPWAPNFAPRGWAFCQGQLQQIAQNPALFSLVGTIYGGDGEVTFGLPDFVGRVAIGEGQGAGLTLRRQGQEFGTNSVALTATQMPAHGHTLNASVSAVSTPGTTNVPGPAVHLAAADLAGNPVGAYGPGDGTTVLGGLSVTPAPTTQVGGGQAHENRMPFQVLNYIIALTGTYPTED